MGFGELGEILNNFEGGKLRKANQELVRREIVGIQLPTIQAEEGENDFGTAISGDLGNSGDQSSLLGQQKTDIGEKALGEC